MSQNRLEFVGLSELKAALRSLPADLTGEATHEAQGAANGAALDIKRAYPARTGKLRDGVIVEHVSSAGRFVAGAMVKNTSPLSHIFENGTQTRHTALGASRGAIPPGHVFIPIVIRARRRMYDRLMDLLRRNGLVVSIDG